MQNKFSEEEQFQILSLRAKLVNVKNALDNHINAANLKETFRFARFFFCLSVFYLCLFWSYINQYKLIPFSESLLHFTDMG